MTNDITQLPVDVDLDLDAEERDPSTIKPPFRTNIKGRVVTMNDPEDFDWRDLALMDNPAEFVRLSMTREDKDHVFSQDLEGWRFNRLMEAYYRHYDLEEKVAEAKRRQRLTAV